MQVLPQRPTAPPWWPPFEVAPILPRNTTQPGTNLETPPVSNNADGRASSFQSSAVVAACTLTVTAAVLFGAVYTCWRSFDSEASTGNATQVRLNFGDRCNKVSGKHCISSVHANMIAYNGTPATRITLGRDSVHV